MTITGLFICMVLSLPAIWQGASITRALAQTLAIVKSRLVEAVLLLVFLGFLCFAVGFIIFGVLGAGLLPTIGMSMSIVGFGGLGMESMMAMSQGYGGGGHAIAGAIGGALLWAVAASLVGQVYLLGLSLVYLRVTEGLDLTASEAALRATFDDAKRRTAELGEKARQAAQRDGAAAASAASVGAASSVGAALAPTPAPAPVPAPVPSVPAPAACLQPAARLLGRARADLRQDRGRSLQRGRAGRRIDRHAGAEGRASGRRGHRHRAALRRRSPAASALVPWRRPAWTPPPTAAPHRHRHCRRRRRCPAITTWPAMPVASDARRRVLRRLRLSAEVK